MIYNRIINNFNFDTINDFEIKNEYIGFKEGFRRVDDYIEIYTNSMASQCVCVYKKDDNFIFTLCIEDLIEYSNITNNIILDVDSSRRSEFGYIYNYLKQRMINNIFKDVTYIENWKRIKVFKNGDYIVERYDTEPYTYELIDNYDLLRKFIIKYKKCTDKLIENKLFIPTMTGGLDTRTLSAFYKDRIDELPFSNMVYLKSVKNDGKNDVKKGNAEMIIAEAVMKTLGMHDVVFTDNIKIVEGCYTLSGIYNENHRTFLQGKTGHFLLNDKTYLYKYVKYGNILSQSNKMIMPFIDDDFLKIRVPHYDTMRCLLAIMLIPELLNIPLILDDGTFKRYGALNFFDRYRDIIEICDRIIEYWGEDKCKSLLE